MPDSIVPFTSNVDGFALIGYSWPLAAPKGVVVISHGAAEHSLRYDRFARFLNTAGYAAWSLDHRGHGASPGPEGLGDFGEGGWDALVADIRQFLDMAKEHDPGVPAVLFGHSMGAGAAQQSAPDHSHAIDALILSGTTLREPPKEGEAPPEFAPNKAFEPARTNYDWLSRDEEEVDRYIADPLCGFEMQRARRPGMRANPFQLNDPERLKRIRPDLPVLLVAGDADPVNEGLTGLDRLEQRWRDAGVRRVDRHVYPGGRHEMLNETNRDDVMAHIVAWLDEVLET